MTDIELLQAVREKLTPEGAWTQHAFARDANGVPTLARTGAAVCWCIIGASIAVCDSERIHRVLGGDSDLLAWSDSPKTKHRNVLARLDAAISRMS